MRLTRRSFIQRSSLLGLGSFLLPSSLFSQIDDESEPLIILHTNDVHSRIEAFPETDPRYGGQGGVLARMQLIEQIRSKYDNVILLDSGDIFQGTPYFNFFGGELEMKLMSRMKYDAATMGNHDFDAGIEGFNKQLVHADFPFLTANYDFSQGILSGKTKSNMVMRKGEFKIGLFGIGIELDGLVPKQLYRETIYLDPIEIAREQASELKRKGCDIIICLSHLGYSYKDKKVSDEQLAAEVADIDLILGGHTHTFLDQAVQVPQSEGRNTWIAQTGWAGLRLGMVMFRRNKDKMVSLAQSGSLAVV